MRQHQQPDDVHQIDFLLPAGAENARPSNHPSRATHVGKDANWMQVNQGQLASDFAAFSRLLIAPQPAERLIPTALDVAARLLSPHWMLRLFESVDSATTLREIVLPSEHQASENQESRMTLGFGEAIDHKVLIEHTPVQTEQMVCVPLINATETLVGVLVAQRRSETGNAIITGDDALLTVSGAYLTILLARAADERLSRSSVLTVRALPGLALPPTAELAVRETDTTHDSVVVEALHAAQEHLLTNAAGAIDEIIEAAGYGRSSVALAITRTRSGEWRLLPAGTPQEQAGSTFASEMLSSSMYLPLQSQHDSVDPLEVGAESNPDEWVALAPLRAYIAKHDGIGVAHLTLLPIIDEGRQVMGWLCLAWYEAAHAGMARLRPLVTSIAIATTAGIRNLRLAEYAQAEGRARDAFISLSAHELRSPLTSIKGYAQLLVRQSKKHALTESMVHSVESIEQQSVRMAEMVGELLDASRIRRGVLDVRTSPVDLAPLARKMVERRAAHFPQHTITLEAPTEPVIALADTQRVEQVLRDLIDNSVRHMPRGGAVTVTLSQQDGMALLIVRDQGLGIPTEERERIFEYLYRSTLSESKNLSGLGLGLYVSRHLIERFGGMLWLEASSTDEPAGSEFRFTLPLAEDLMGYTLHE